MPPTTPMLSGNEDCKITETDNIEVEQNKQEATNKEYKILSERGENEDGKMEDDHDDVAEKESNCQICSQWVTFQVFKCDRGHKVCLNCARSTMIFKNACPSCPAMEKLVETVKVFCRNKQYGCEEIISYNKQLEHELSCIYGGDSDTSIGTTLADDNEPKDLGITNVPSVLEQPYLRPQRTRKAPTWLKGFQR